LITRTVRRAVSWLDVEGGIFYVCDRADGSRRRDPSLEVQNSSPANFCSAQNEVRFMPTKIHLVLASAAFLLLACSSGAPQGDAAPGAGGSAGSIGAGGVGGSSTTGAGVAGSSGTGVAGSGATGAAGAGVAGAGSPDGGTGAGGAAGGQDDDDALIVPQGLEVSLEQGGAGVLDLYALTLRDGPDGLELYAALTNDGDVPACDAALKVTLYDTSGQPLGNFINGLDTKSFYLYTLPDASTTIAACAAPGDVTMTEIDTMASNISVADVGQVVYYYSYFALDAVLIDGLTVTQVNVVAGNAATNDAGTNDAGTNDAGTSDAGTGNAGTTYTGTVLNGLDQTVTDPSIRVFPLNRVGRPLGVAGGSDSSQVPAGGTWTFRTNTVDTPGVGYAAFPAASF
jgi:hypothetical protein